MGGAKIYFDSRLSNPKRNDPILTALGERKNQVPFQPSYTKVEDQNSPSLRSGFKPNSEALYEAHQSEYLSSNAIKAKIVQQTVERYNLIKKFLTTFENDTDSQFASYLITEMLKSLKTDELSEYDRMLAYVKTAVASSRHVKVS